MMKTLQLLLVAGICVLGCSRETPKTPVRPKTTKAQKTPQAPTKLEAPATPQPAKSDWQTFTAPEFGGRIFTVEFPKDWTIHSLNGDVLVIFSPAKDRYKDPYVSVTIMVYDLATNWRSKQWNLRPEDWQTPEAFLDNCLRKHWKSDYKVEEEARQVPLLGGKGFVRVLSKQIGETTYRVQYYDVVVDGQIHVHAAVSAACQGPISDSDREQVMKAMSPTVEKIVRSIKVRAVSSLSKEERDRMVPLQYNSGSIRISQRRHQALDVSIRTLLPPGWTVKQVRKVLASDQSPQGEFVTEFLAAGGSKGDDGAKLMVVLLGMPIGPLTKQDFLSTTAEQVKRIIPENKLLKSEQMPLFASNPLGWARTKFTERTGDPVVNTFTGKDAQGKELKVKTYTVGGMTAVCHFIYVADADRFEKLLPAVEQMMRLMRIELPSHPLFR